MSNHISRVSVGLPVFNGENYLRQALDSLLAQTFTDFELIISDNGSTDCTQEICRAYAARDTRIRYYRHEKNVGAAKNFNFTVEVAVGEYFKWASHDDMCAPEFLQQCVEVLDNNPEIVLSYPYTIFVDEYDQLQETYMDNLNLRSPRPSKRLSQFFANPGWCHPIFGLIRTSILRETPCIGNYPRSDRNLLGQLALYGQFYEIPEYLFFRRLHPQISTAVNKTELEIASWFDPLKKGKLIFPRWRRLFEYMRAIASAPLSWPERTRCFLEVGRFTFIPKKWIGIIADLFNAVNIAPNFLSKSKREKLL